jgi:hypothetical protein
MNAICIHGLLAASLLFLPAGAAHAPQSPQPAPPAPEQSGTSTVAVPLPQGIHLVLKDGNFLLVREYKIEGDRVRYWSVERSAWEEIPAQLVDWDATHAGEAAEALRKQQINKKLEEIAQEQRAAALQEIDASIEVGPNVFLPPDPGLYVVANGNVASLSQDLAVSTMNKRRILLQVITPIPVVQSKHDVKLAGPRASLRINGAQPEFYFRTADAREPSVTLVRAQVRGDHRLLLEINTNVAGISKSKQRQMLTQGWLVARGVYRYTLEQKLEPGEYAFVENDPDRGVDLLVWDFGVDSGAGGAPKH